MVKSHKFIWIILIGLIGVLIGQLIYISNIKYPKFNLKEKIAGTQVTINSPQSESLKKLPKKTTNYQDLEINAKSVILVDVPTSSILFSKNSEEKLPIASTTKIMTALVVLENHNAHLEDVVTISYPMIAVEGSDIQLRIGEKITVINLIKGLLIMSGNDTAYALATYFGGTESFVKEMNEKAKYLGLKNSNYKDPAGLNDEGYSTSDDLAFIASYAMRNKLFSDIVRTPSINISSIDKSINHELKSSNRMLRQEENYYYPYAIGIKTGFTYAAGHSLISAAKKDDHQILGVILNTNENSLTASAKESRRLLEWGFDNWEW